MISRGAAVSAAMAVFTLASGGALMAADGAPASGSELSAQAQEVRQGLEPGQTPPDFSVKDLDGHPQSLSAAKDQIVVLHFWASWCPYCRKEIPKLKQIQQQWARDGVKILAVSVDEDVSKLERFVRDSSLPYTVISEVKNRQPLSQAYEVNGIPATYVIDRDWLVANHFEGQADLISAVRRLVGEHAEPAS